MRRRRDRHDQRRRDRYRRGLSARHVARVRGPDKTPFHASWRKYVDDFDGEKIVLNAPAPDIRFSTCSPDEILLAPRP